MIEEYKTNAKALLDNPDDPMALVNQFGLLAEHSGRTPAHIALTRRAVSLAPNAIEAMFNLGSAQLRAGHYANALASFQMCLPIAGNRKAEALHHIGMAHHDLGEFSRAIDWYDRALAESEDAEIWRSRAIARLADGHLADGLFDFEVQWHRPVRKPIAESGIPRWRGQPLEDNTIIVAHEQGFGDTIQFIRFLPKVKAKKIIVSMPDVLSGLIKENYSADEFVDENGPFSADYYCSPMSACAALGVEYGGFDGKPYLKSEALELPRRGKLKVGLAWRGSPGYAYDADRSMSLEALCPLFDLPGAAFYSFQMDNKEVSRLGLDGFIADLSWTVKSRPFTETAKAIQAMDVVVTVETAIAQLAGALGKPVLLLLSYSCCWRWMRKRSDTPWHDSVRLFRQPIPNDWSGPVDDVRNALRKMLL